MRRKTTYNEFVEKANKIFNFVFDYSKFVYVDNHTKGIIICPIHGEFSQQPKNHLNGQGCSRCSNNKKLNTETFIEKASCIHQKYDYSQVNYINTITKVKIGCPIHGIFEQTPNNHLCSSQGCPKCRESKGERLIRGWLTKNKLEFDGQYTIFGCKNKMSLFFDFAIFEHQKLVGLIEYNGKQHYKSKLSGDDKLKAEKMLAEIKYRNQIKQEYCKTHNIPLLLISYKEMSKLDTLLKEFVPKPI